MGCNGRLFNLAPFRNIGCISSSEDDTVPMPFEHKKPRYSLNDLSDLLGLGKTTLHAEVRKGRLRTYRVGGRTFADPVDLDSYLDLCRKESA